MKRSYFRFAVLELLLFTTLLPSRVDAAAAPYKVVYTFGGLNDRSGILWVARDAGFFTSTASIRPSSTCASAQWACPRWRARIVAADERPRGDNTRRYLSGAPLKHVVRAPDGTLQGFENPRSGN